MKYHEVVQHGVSTGSKAIGQIKWVPALIPNMASWMESRDIVPGQAKIELITDVSPAGFGVIEFGKTRQSYNWEIVESAEIWLW